ncbi:c-type cytochrome biogenesis protein CcmI [Aliiroseovarius sp.]|uniref:c-type cytochrome biogenesis protein CcmI n=1 Tax=Aliiroseovarius sp. TaxID=1872442 RepID=UPI0026174EE7|nr:c-type cytochrome biogenesis protein CcmI [Aliiroseovarius sp.]
MIFAWMGLLLVIAVGFVVFPLIRGGHGAPVAADTTPAVLIDQLNEVQRDLDRKLISASEATAAKLEIKRRILAASRRSPAEETAATGKGNGLMLAAGLFVPVLAIGYYMLMGSPEISSLAYADRQAERAEQQKIYDLTEKLYARLMAEPDGGASEGWELLGQTLYRLGEYERAIAAYETVTAREDARSATFSMLAEALISAEQGIVTPRAEAAIDRAVELDPDNLAGSFYKSMALAQRGEEATAHDLLLSMLNGAPGYAPWMDTFIAQANQIGEKLGRDAVTVADFAEVGGAGAGPTAADVAAAGEMSVEDRAEFIRSMVDRLAVRLEENPEDLDGWLRLANAYSVLGEEANAVSALKQAETLLASLSPDDPRRDAVAKALSEMEK